ncbi:MAG: ATP-binding protein [Tetrasphaera sp.]
MTSRWSPLSLRGRLMSVALLGVAAALLAGGLLLYVVMTSALERAVEESARETARGIAALVVDGRLPDPAPGSTVLLVQVLDQQNRVVGASANADRLVPLVDPSQRQRLIDGETVRIPGSRAAVTGPLVVAGSVAAPASGTTPYLVVAAVPRADTDSTRALLGRLLLVFFPLLLALLALVAWRVVGSALRPVDEVRRAAEEIGTGPSLERRLPVPPTSDEIAALATTLNGMLARIEGAQRKQRSFVADAAHELRSPLTSIRTQLEVAGHLGDGGELPDELLPEVERLSRLVEDLLVLARLDDDPAGVRSERVDLASLAQGVASRFAGARVPVTVDIAAESVVAQADPTGTSRAVRNLVDNAVRHARSRVTITVAWEAQWAVISVADDGSGIPQQDRERVFDRFTRLDDGRDRDSGGSGLGLAITRALVERGGGGVRIEDAGPGVRAVIRLPW